MLVGLCEIIFYLPESKSLKDKRNILSSIKAILRKNYNISIAEIGYKETWKKSLIVVCCIGDNRKLLDQILNNIIIDIEARSEIQIIDYRISIN